MRISKADLGEIATNFLDFLNSQNIENMSDLENLLFGTYPIKNSEDFIKFELRPSFYDFAHTLTYVRPNAGAPIELRIHQTM